MGDTISIEDIKEVAEECGFKEPTKEQITYVQENYNIQADEDPSGFWRTWVEDLLYNIDVEKKSKKKLG